MSTFGAVVGGAFFVGVAIAGVGVIGGVVVDAAGAVVAVFVPWLAGTADGAGAARWSRRRRLRWALDLRSSSSRYCFIRSGAITGTFVSILGSSESALALKAAA